MGEVQEQLTAREWQERYVAEQAVDRDEAARLIELEAKAKDEDLTPEEKLERLQLERNRPDTEARLRRLQYAMATAQDDVDTESVLTEDDALRAEKVAAYAKIELCTDLLVLAYKELFRIHHQQEEVRARLPRAGNRSSDFPSGAALAMNVTSRLPRGWNGILTTTLDAWRIDWGQVQDIDPGLKPLEETAVGRIKETARLYREKLAQQIAIAEDEADDE